MGAVSRRILSLILAGFTAGLSPAGALANPSGGVVVGGGATIAGQGTSTVTVNQTSNAAVLSWQKFNIAQGETTNFVQPGVHAIALNRILDGQASSILGNLNANGRVYLINPNGILFGQSAVVNVGGLAAATNAQVSNLIDAQTSALASAQGAPGAAITNQGHINVAPGGDVYLVGARVENSTTGVIHVDGGIVKVASGAVLTLAGEDGVAVEYQVPTTPDNTAVNLGQILADKGIVDIRASIVRQDGKIQASKAVEHEGQIILTGDSELHVDGDTVTDNGDVTATSGGDVVIGAGGNLRSQTGDVTVTSTGHDVLFTSTDQNNDSVVETGSGNIRVDAKHDVNLQPNLNAAGNTAIRTRGIDVTESDGHGGSQVVHEKGDGGNVVVIAETGNVNAGSADRWIDSAPVLDPAFFDPGTYPTGYDPIPVDPRGILGIGSEAGGNVTVIAFGNVSTRRSDVNVTRTGGSATTLPPLFDPSQPVAFDYDGSHIGVFGQPYKLADNPFGAPVQIAQDAPKAKLTVISGGDITGDYMIRNGTATFRAGYTLEQSALDQIVADPGALAAIESSGLLQRSDKNNPNADPTVGWLGSLRSPLTIDMAFASADGRGANGVALRAAENPSLVYPPNNVQGAGGNAKLPLYGESDSLVLDAEHGDVVLLGNDDKLREGGVTSTDPPSNPYVHVLPPNVTITTHDFTRGLESRGGDLVLLNDFTMLPSLQGGLSLNVAGEVRTAHPVATGKPTVGISPESFGASGDLSFSLPAGLVLVDPKTGAEYTLDQAVPMQERLPELPARGPVQFNLSSQALQNGITIPAGTKLVTRSGEIFSTEATLVIPPTAQRQRQTEVVFQLDHPTDAVITLSSAQVRLVGPDGALYALNQDVQIRPGQSSIQVSATALVGGGADLRPGQLKLQTPVDGVVGATNITVSTRPALTTVFADAQLPGSEGTILDREIVGLQTPIAGVISATNPSQLVGKDKDQFGNPSTGGTPINMTAVSVVGPAGIPAGGAVLEVASGQVLPPGVSASDLIFTVIGRFSQSQDALVPAVFKDLQITRDAAGNIISTSVDAPAKQLVLVDASQVWKSSAQTFPPAVPVAHITQSQASPQLPDARGTAVFDYSSYFKRCRAGAACSITNPFDPNSPTLTVGSGPTHAGNPAPALLLAKGGFDRVGFDLAEAATVWSGADVVDLTLKTAHADTVGAHLTQLVVPNGNVRLGAGTETLVDNQLGVPVNVQVPDDPGSGLNVSGPGEVRVLVGVAPHTDPIEGFDGALAALVPKPVDPTDGGITLAEWTDKYGTAESFTGFDNRGLTPPATGDGKLFAKEKEAPWIPIDKTGATGNLELNDVGGENSLGLLSSGNTGNAALGVGGASIQVVVAGNIDLHRFGAIGTVQGGDVNVQSVAGRVFAEQPPPQTHRQRGIFAMNAVQQVDQLVNQPTGGGEIVVDANDDVDSGGSAIATLSSSDIRITSRNGSIIGGHGAQFGAVQVAFDPVTQSPTVNYDGAGISALGSGRAFLTAHKDINLGAGIRAQGIVLNALGNVTAGTGSATAQTISIQAGGTISGSFSASSISIGSGTLSSGATVSAGVVSGGGGAVSNTSANQVSASAIATASAQGSNPISETAAGQAASGLRGVIIDVSSRPCDEKDECR
ncbi:MAG TPA: filamentous hemagglutinin N-terminal domain-containing protein [Myxococcota bacterium]|nr:filamentous hemagglutinin N-terminal domain-containing protein [Myxococcota bacterium]